MISAKSVDHVAMLQDKIGSLSTALAAEREKGEVTTGDHDLSRASHLDTCESYISRVDRLLSFLGNSGQSEPDWPWDDRHKELIGAILTEAFTAGLFIGQHLQLAVGKKSEADSIELERRDQRAREGGVLGGQNNRKELRYRTLEKLLAPKLEDFRDAADKGKVKLVRRLMRDHDSKVETANLFTERGKLLSEAWVHEFCEHSRQKLQKSREK
ncbi:MAG: hypothetical protein JJT81_07270 [Rubellimicrobium sp.]|nr:hypothetical protein [Rubellimicrobium sp.]